MLVKFNNFSFIIIFISLFALPTTCHANNLDRLNNNEIINLDKLAVANVGKLDFIKEISVLGKPKIFLVSLKIYFGQKIIKNNN